MNEIDVHHLAAAYALDALDEHERAVFEAHFGACDVCRSDVHDFRNTLASVAESLATPPPALLRDKVMVAVAVTRQLSPMVASVSNLDRRRRARTVLSMVAAAAALVMIVVGVVFITGNDRDEFSADLALVMQQPDSRVLTLENIGGGAGTFKVAWSNSLGKAVLIGDNLAAAPNGKAYELWMVTPDKVMPMDVLDPAADGNVHRNLTTSAAPIAWAITIEPKAGTPAPTGDIIYTGKVV